MSAGPIRPRGTTIAMILAAVQLPRLGAVRFFFLAQDGTLPPAFAIPAGVGDVAVAVTAPLVILGLRRGGLSAWAWSIAWNALGILDLAFALAVGALSDFPLEHRMSLAPSLTAPLAIIPMAVVPVCILCHALSIVLLSTRPAKAYFRQRDDARG